MRKTLLSLSFIFLFCFSQAQQKLPAFNYIPQAPTTAAFTRYGDIPVDISTGVTNVSIPIYTLNENGMNIPISISYHASGIKVSDIASSVGLGWTLNAGGVITRTVMGIKDEQLDILGSDGLPMYEKPPFRNSQQFENYNWDREAQNRFIWADEMHSTMVNWSGRYDFYSDRFYYNLGNGESGFFRKDFINDVFKFMPYRPMKVRLIPDNTVFNGLKIEMTTSDGTRYLFKRNKYDTWHPEKIFNNSNTDSIVFYTHADTIQLRTYSFSQEFGPYGSAINPKTEAFAEPRMAPGLCDFLTRVNNVPNSIAYQVTFVEDEVILVDSIVGKNAVIRFNYAKDRQDAWFATGTILSRLTGVQVYNKANQHLIKNVTFSHSYSGSVPLDKRLMLNSIQTGASGEEKYTFGYNPESLPAYYSTASQESYTPVFFQDFWGYNRGGNPSYSNLFSDFAPSGEPNLYPNEDRAKASILTEVKYPTGGKTVFEYESHRVPAYFYGPGFNSPPSDGKVGGLRIKKISSYAYEGASPQVKTYEYVCELPASYGQLNVQKFTYYQETFNYLVGGPEVCGPVSAEHNYTYKNVCLSNPMGRYIGGSQAPVYYNKVTEYNGDGINNVGKTVYHFQILHESFYQLAQEPRYFGPWDRDFGSYVPPLEKKEEYKFDGGQYKLVRKTENEYSVDHLDDFSTGLNLSSHLQFNNLGGDASFAFNHYNWLMMEWYFSTLHYSDPVAYTKLDVLAETRTYDYTDNNNYLLTTTNYTYNQYCQQTSVATTTSKGDVLKTKITYPADYPATAPYNTMIERNILSPVVEQSLFKSSSVIPETFLQSTKTNYDYWDFAGQTWGNNTSNYVLPKYVETKKGDEDVETRVRYFSYDAKGNPTYFAKEDDVRQLLIWSYNKAYPVAQVMNVPDEQKQIVSYTSFEDIDNGNWSVSGPQPRQVDNTAPTGRQCLSLVQFTQISQTLNAGSSYILSYWYKNGATVNISANSTIITSSQPKNGWIYVKRKITGASSLSISGTGFIDELRLYPETAQMTTFAYEPLVGMSAQCDVNDRITYYTYDASGRLSLVKDDNGNVLKKICYNFQGQPDACGENAIPLWQLTGTTRCKPCPQNPVYFTNITQLEERDNNVNSETYGNTRWRDTGVIGGVGACFAPGDWQPTGVIRCKTIGGQNTGEQEREMKDMNLCSATGGNIVWEVIGMNTNACPAPVVFQSLDVSGNYYKQNCGSQQVPRPYPVSMPQGSFTSSVSVQDATNQARAQAQQMANQNGQCATVYVKSVKVLKTDPAEQQQYTDHYFYFYSDAAGTIPMALPSGLTINFKYMHGGLKMGTFHLMMEIPTVT